MNMNKKVTNNNVFSNTITKFKLLIILIVMSMVSVSCSDDDNGTTTVDENIVDEEPSAKDDALEASVASKTYIYKADYSSTAAALIRRITNITDRIDETVETIIIHDSNIPTLTDKDYNDIITLVLRGGCVAYCSATEGNADLFFRNLQRIGGQYELNSIIEYTEEGLAAYDNIMLNKNNTNGLMIPPSLSMSNNNGTLCDVYAFKGRDTYIVDNLDEAKEIETITIGDDEDENAAPITEKLQIPSNDINNNYLTGLHADGLAKWIDKKKDALTKFNQMMRGQALLRAATKASDVDDIQLDNIAAASTVDYSFTAYGAYKTAPVTLSYEIWPVNNTTGTDYYLIHQHLLIENSKLGIGPKESMKWDGHLATQYYGKYKAAYHAYMAGITNEASLLLDKSKYFTDHVSPTNEIGSSSFSESGSWTLTQSFVSLSLSGAVSMSKSYSYTVDDLEFYYENNKNGRLHWDYSQTSQPHLTASNTYASHSEPKKIQISDLDLDYCWIWRVPNADKQYSFRGIVTATLEGAWMKHKTFYKVGYKQFINKDSIQIALPQPPRFQQQWQMSLVPYNDSAFNHMEKFLDGYFVAKKNLNTITKDDTVNINRWIKTVGTVINNNPRTVKEAYKNQKSVSFELIWKDLTTKLDYDTLKFEFQFTD